MSDLKSLPQSNIVKERMYVHLEVEYILTTKLPRESPVDNWACPAQLALTAASLTKMGDVG